MRILVQFPTFKRREKFLDCLKKYVQMSSGRHALHFNIVCDYNDDTMNNFSAPEEIHSILDTASHCSSTIFFDRNTTKIGAINAHIDDRIGTFDILVCASDDMIPQVRGWDDEIASAMTEHFPNLDGALHFNDGNDNSKNLITLSIMGVGLYLHFGYVYHPDYNSLYCDNEFTDEVYALKKVQYIDKTIIRHEHYSIAGNSNSGEYDQAAEKTLKYSGRDGTIYGQRKILGFPSHKITND